ncbi:glycerate kinase [Azotosporobacter soli]|uniref:glycerate kinase n=1 Tax=Azotosporobacter soli TaxID=3055040 RepID=UPI0031FF3921
MKIIVAPDSYKGSLTAVQVASAMARGIGRVYPEAQVVQMPIADGGEGTVVAMVAALGGEMVETTVQGPLGAPVVAQWGLVASGETAVIEMAAASGLPLLSSAERDPLRASSHGTGELIVAALDKGVKRIIIGLGGSATNDGGAGMAQALGAKLYDDWGKPLQPGGAALARLETVDLSALDARLAETEIWVACDVDNPLCGPQGASAVYGPQKGATSEMVAQLDAALAVYAGIMTEATGRAVAEKPGTGAAGGLGAGLLWLTNARLRPGVEMVLEVAEFEKQLLDTDWVLTGEGRTDQQTAFGKAPIGVASAAKRHAVPVALLSGGLSQGWQAVLEAGIDAAASVVPGPMRLEECLAAGEELVADGAERLCLLLALGEKLKKH